MTDILLALNSNNVLDPEGLCADLDTLTANDWSITSNSAESAEWSKSTGTLQLSMRRSQDNPHRVVWELGIMAKDTKIGYASAVMRPGDLSAESVRGLIQLAVKTGEDEQKVWNDALAEARRSLGI